MALNSYLGTAGRYSWLVVIATLVAMACGGEDNSGDDDDDAAAGTTTTTTTGGTPNPADCPASNPGNAQSCNGVEPGLACSYAGSNCTCSGLTWNCLNSSGSGAGNTAQNNTSQVGGSNTNTTGSTSGNGFGDSAGDSSDGSGSSTTGGFNTDCEGLTPAQGEACESSGTVCGLEGGLEQVCVCFALSSDAPTWSCASADDSGGFGGSGGD